MNRLPDTSGMPGEIVMVRSQRNFYDHALRAAGVQLVEVGLPDRYAGAGVRDAEAWEIADAIGERTAAVHWVASPAARPALEEVVAVAHARRGAGPGRCRGPAAAGVEPAPLRRRRRRSGGVQRRQGDRRTAGLGHPVRPARSDHGGRPAEPRPRRVLRAVGAAGRVHRQKRASRACRSTASAAAARSARRRSSGCWSRSGCSSRRTPARAARAGCA